MEAPNSNYTGMSFMTIIMEVNVYKEMLNYRFLGSDLMCNHLLWDTLMQVVSGGQAHYWNNCPL